MAAITIIHLLFLNQTGLNNQCGLNKNTDKIPFHPYFGGKDILGLAVIIIIIDTNPTGTLDSRRSKQLYASKPSSITSIYPTRMIRPIRIRNPRSIPNKLGGLIKSVIYVGLT